MTKNQAKIIMLKQFNSDADLLLAGFLKITRQTVHAWHPDKPIPLHYQWMLHGLFPEVFPKPERHDFYLAVERQAGRKSSHVLNN